MTSELEQSEIGLPEALSTRKMRQKNGLIGKLWGHLVCSFAWLCRPDEVGQPIVITPRNLRLLILLVLGNLLLFVLLIIGLYRASTMVTVTVEQVPVYIPITVTVMAAPPPSPPPSPTPFGSGGSIAFTLRRNGNSDIYLLNQADKQLVRATYDPAEDRDPTWSPDGNYIAFASNRSGNWDIYLLDLLSGALIRLTHDPAFDAGPSWSPDGKWIAFESYRTGSLDIFIMSTSGEQVRRLTFDEAPEYGPVWSPDSRAIAYTAFKGGNKDIYVRLVDGSGAPINVTQSPELDEDEPAWSPDGTRLAYVSGLPGNPSIHIAAFDRNTMSVDRAQTELFGIGNSPSWAPDGLSFAYVRRRAQVSHLVAASAVDWALFHEIYSVEGIVSDLRWAVAPLPPRLLARARANAPADELPLYVELLRPTPTAGPPYRLLQLPGVLVQPGTPDDDRTPEIGWGGGTLEPGESITETRKREKETPEEAYLSDLVNESFNALRQRVIKEAGWDYLANLSTASLPLTYTPYSGHSRMTWHVCGRAFSLDRRSYEIENPPRVELVKEDAGNVTYWRVFIRAARQDGTMGEPLRTGVWDLNARQEDEKTLIEGGRLKSHIPSGYYVDFTALAADYGWERVPSLWRWRYFWPDVLWWRYQKTDGLSWWECMLELFEPAQIEDAFGPIPEYKK
ncbi:MAG: DPP IV N-terminal domain-containing protein [Anaerolineae bacterium]|nr:DPP IV N-terminal domain-containing protein [Anaerolineae bacterium]